MTTYHCFVETPFETRNLQRPAYAVRAQFLETPDETRISEELEHLRREHSRHFIHLRLSKVQLRLSGLFERQGFQLVESSTAPELDIGNWPETFSPSLYERILRSLSSGRIQFQSLPSGPDLPLEQMETLAKHCFHNDRFHLDRRCPRELADRRFVHWLQDLATDPEAIFDLLSANGNLVGFTVRKGRCWILSCLSPRQAGGTWGMTLWVASTRAMQRHLENHAIPTSKTVSIQSVSYNNLASVNLCASLGFHFPSVHYSFHQWHGAFPPGQ